MWRNVRLILLVAGICAIPIAALLGQQSPEEKAPKSPKIGIVDVAKVFDGYTKRMELDDEITAQAEAFKKKQEGIRREIEGLMDRLELLAPDSEGRASKELELQIKQLELQNLTQTEGKRIAARQGELIAELYNEVARTIREYGDSEGYALILKYDTSDIKGTSAGSAELKIAVRSVLYYAPETDITQRILDILNKRYAERKQGS